MDTEIKYINDKTIEFTGELDPDAEVSDICLNKIVEKALVGIKVYVPMNLNELEAFFRWAGSNGIKEYTGDWKLTLERINK